MAIAAPSCPVCHMPEGQHMPACPLDPFDQTPEAKEKRHKAKLILRFGDVLTEEFINEPRQRPFWEVV